MWATLRDAYALWLLRYTNFDCRIKSDSFYRSMGYKRCYGWTSLCHLCDVLIPEIEPGTVVVLDYLATHRNKQAAKALREHGCWFLFLPPYSPDLNPNEMAFSKLKANLRRISARSFTDVFDAIAQVCELFHPRECSIYSMLQDISLTKVEML